MSTIVKPNRQFPHVKFTCGGPFPNDKVSITLDDHDITHNIRSIHISAGVGRVNNVNIEVAPSSLEVDIPADVMVGMYPYPGYEVVKVPIDNGVCKYIQRKTAGQSTQEYTRIDRDEPDAHNLP